MSTTEIRKRLHSYIELAEDRKIKVLYTMVEDDMELEDPWKNKAFVAEIIKRDKEMKSGKAKTYSYEDVKNSVGKILKAAKKR